MKVIMEWNVQYSVAEADFKYATILNKQVIAAYAIREIGSVCHREICNNMIDKGLEVPIFVSIK